MNTKDKQILIEQYYRFIGISGKKKQNKILNILSYCKEIRDTAYPMKNSKVTELELVEFVARKEKDLIYINGSLSLCDEQSENRTFEAYIIENKEEGNIRVYMDITRICVDDEPKMIRTSEVISEEEDKVSVETTYALTDSTMTKVSIAELPKDNKEAYILQKKYEQISAL